MFEYELSWLSQGLLPSVVVQSQVEPPPGAQWPMTVREDRDGRLDDQHDYHRAGRATEPADFAISPPRVLHAAELYGLAALYTVLTFVCAW